MKALAWIVLGLLLCVCAYNLWATHKLNVEVQEITTALASGGKVELTPPTLPEIRKLVNEAQAHLEKAQGYLAEGHPADSKLHLELALEKLEEARELAEQGAGDDKGLLGEIKGVAGQIKDTLGKSWPKPGKSKSDN